MALSWEDYTEIACFMAQNHKDKSPSALSDSDLMALIYAMPDFRGEEEDPVKPNALTAIRAVWADVLSPAEPSPEEDSAL